MIAELVDYWTRSNTPIQSVSQLVVYFALIALSATGGWFLHDIRKD